MTGKYIDCDWCGTTERSSKDKTINSFRKWLQHNLNWVNIRMGNGIVYDFCSNDCYQRWKNDQ